MNFVSFNFSYFEININFKTLFINFKVFFIFLFDFNILYYYFNIHLVIIMKIRDYVINIMFFNIDDIRKKDYDEIINLKMVKTFFKEFFNCFFK